MAIRAICESCGTKIKAEERHAGRTVPCPKCQSPLTIPAASLSDELIDPFAEEAESFASPPLPKQTVSSQTAKPPIKASSAPPPAENPNKRRPQPAQKTPVPPPEVADAVTPMSEAAICNGDENDAIFPDLSDEDLAGEALTVRKKKRVPVDDDELPSTAVTRSPKRPRRGMADLPAVGWRQHLHWVLILCLMPLVLSTVLGEDLSTLDQIEKSLENHPELNPDAVLASETLHEVAMQFPDHRLDGALLMADSYWHWGFALVSSGVFLALFLSMWPGKESRATSLVTTGVVTGTIGIMLLLGFQWVAFATQGVVLTRGRGIVALLFLIVQFIGYSYRCALEEGNGFVSSVFGFTFGVGLCEELCKALPVAFCLSGHEKRSLRDVCLIGLASGVGFGVSEGITYSAEYYNGIQGVSMYLIRFLSCVSLHAIWAGGVALLMYRNQDYLEWSWEAALGFVVYYLLAAMILHGVYDTLLKQDHELLAVLSALVSFGWFQWTLSRTSQAIGEA